MCRVGPAGSQPLREGQIANRVTARDAGVFRYFHQPVSPGSGTQYVRSLRIGSITHVFRENPPGNRPSDRHPCPLNPREPASARPPATGNHRPFPLHNSRAPTRRLQFTLPRPVGPTPMPSHVNSRILLAPRHTHPSGGARGAGSRKSSRTGVACSRCARIFPITAGSSMLGFVYRGIRSNRQYITTLGIQNFPDLFHSNSPPNSINLVSISAT